VALRYVRGPDATQVVRLLVLVDEAQNSLRRFDEVQLLWIPRHRNAEADRLSRQALGLPGSAAGMNKGRRRRR
jgi:ribonuclease HI